MQHNQPTLAGETGQQNHDYIPSSYGSIDRKSYPGTDWDDESAGVAACVSVLHFSQRD